MTEPVAVIPVTESVELGVVSASSPAQLVARATEAADALAGVIAAKGLFSSIQGRRYVKCEGWTTLAAMMGCLPREEQTVEREDGSYEAVVALVRMRDGQVLTRASAECGRGEKLWMDRAPYARRSMAVTRATSKACRIAFSWVMTLAGYEVTPAEEMPHEESGRGRSSSGRTKDAPAAPPPAPLSEFPPQLSEEVDPLAPGEKLMPMGQHKGAKLGVLSSNVLLGARTWMTEHKRYPDIVQAIEKILAGREGE